MDAKNRNWIIVHLKYTNSVKRKSTEVFGLNFRY